MKKVRLAALVLACALPGAAAAEDIRVLSAAALAPGLVKVAEQYRKDTKNRARVQYADPARLERRLGAGESADVLIATPGVMNDQLRRNKIEPDKHVFIGRAGIGVMIRVGITDPEIGSLDPVKQSLLGADSIVYTLGGSGLYLEKMFELLGVSEQIKPKTTRYANASQVLEHVLSGKGVE